MATKKAPIVRDSSIQPESKLLKVEDLDFDTQNPRFPSHIANGPTSILIERFIRDERLLEIIESISDSGFFPGEPLLVVKSGKRYTVIEGNRRLAALKLLTEELEVPKGRISIDEAIRTAKYRPNEVQCLIFQQQDQILRYLGFRHITGIKSWAALQKARYMERLLAEHYPDTDYKIGLNLLARETGTKAAYLGQILSSLKLYKTAEENNFFGLDIDPESIDFSILSTALSYKNILDFVGLDSRIDIEHSNVSEKNLKMLFFWLFVTKTNQKSIVGESRNLKKLAAIVASPEAIGNLNREGHLDEAFEYSKGPGLALSESLNHADRRLKAAWDWISKIPTEELSNEHYEKATSIRRLATRIQEQISMSSSIDL